LPAALCTEVDLPDGTEAVSEKASEPSNTATPATPSKLFSHDDGNLMRKLFAL
jgi:hypothetical protein